MSADHEFKVHHLMGELVSLFHVQDTSGVDSHVDLLLKHRSPYVTTQVRFKVGVAYRLVLYCAALPLLSRSVRPLPRGRSQSSPRKESNSAESTMSFSSGR